MSGYAHPASIQARAGSVLEMIERQIEQQDIAGMVNFVRLFRAYCGAYLEEEPDLKRAYEAVPPFGYDDGHSETDAFQNEINRVEILCRLLKKKNIMGYDTVGMGESEALREKEVEG